MLECVNFLVQIIELCNHTSDFPSHHQPGPLGGPFFALTAVFLKLDLCYFVPLSFVASK